MKLQLSCSGRLLAVISMVVLVACGGGHSGDSDADGGVAGSTDQGTAAFRPTVFTSEGRTLNSCSLEPACSGNPLAPFFVNASMAPADGATVSGVVRVEISGNQMANVELLPATGYTPRLGVFNRSADNTRAWFDLDTTRLPNGPARVRVSAFNVPPGQPGAAEIVAVPARTWNVNNTAPAPGTFAATLASAPASGTVVSGVVRLEVRGSGIANAELLPATGGPKLGVFNVAADKTRAWLDLDSRSVPDGVADVRIDVFNMTEGQPGAARIVAMPARRWDFRNGAGFAASVTMAPLHGEVVSGTTRLEVRGTGMRNVELLPASGYAPRLGVFNVSADGKFAWLDFDTATLPNGVRDARISAFNVLPGQPGAVEIVAMPVRQWQLQH
jgi:hypothetical protein